MKLGFELKQKITERFLKKVDISVKDEIDDVITDLLNGEYEIHITTSGKYTISDIEYNRNGYGYHFIDVASRNPNDENNMYYGIKVATESALLRLIGKFYTDEVGLCYTVE